MAKPCSRSEHVEQAQAPPVREHLAVLHQDVAACLQVILLADAAPLDLAADGEAVLQIGTCRAGPGAASTRTPRGSSPGRRSVSPGNTPCGRRAARSRGRWRSRAPDRNM